MKMGPLDGLSRNFGNLTTTQLTTNLRCVTSQKSEGLIYTAAKA